MKNTLKNTIKQYLDKHCTKSPYNNTVWFYDKWSNQEFEEFNMFILKYKQIIMTTNERRTVYNASFREDDVVISLTLTSDNKVIVFD